MQRTPDAHQNFSPSFCLIRLDTLRVGPAEAQQAGEQARPLAYRVPAIPHHLREQARHRQPRPAGSGSHGRSPADEPLSKRPIRRYRRPLIPGGDPAPQGWGLTQPLEHRTIRSGSRMCARPPANASPPEAAPTEAGPFEPNRCDPLRNSKITRTCLPAAMPLAFPQPPLAMDPARPSLERLKLLTPPPHARFAIRVSRRPGGDSLGRLLPVFLRLGGFPDCAAEVHGRNPEVNLVWNPEKKPTACDPGGHPGSSRLPPKPSSPSTAPASPTRSRTPAPSASSAGARSSTSPPPTDGSSAGG